MKIDIELVRQLIRLAHEESVVELVVGDVRIVPALKGVQEIEEKEPEYTRQPTTDEVNAAAYATFSRL